MVTSDKIEEGAAAKTVDASAIPAGQMALDIGPKTIERFSEEISQAGTIVWNGPMGVFEIGAFENGTMKIAEAIASAKGFSLVGGGDSVRAVQQAGVSDRISYISTGGGAFMEFMGAEPPRCSRSGRVGKRGKRLRGGPFCKKVLPVPLSKNSIRTFLQGFPCRKLCKN